MLGRVTKVSRSGTFPTNRYGGLEYEYTGLARIARRTIGGSYHTYYDYSVDGNVTSYAVLNGKTQIIKNRMRHQNGLPGNVATSMYLPGEYFTSKMLEPTYSPGMKVTQTSFAESFS
ncbi:MAG: hypothetical protein GTO40_21800, partial [Deltaproteobacteria bacterium]|nr:hypothetical protein [Deltaproteobacteria bacterium]